MIKNLFCVALFFLIVFSCQTNQEGTTVSKKEIKETKQLSVGRKQMISSTILNEDRPIIISLPKDYDISDAKYPVLYLTDGLQNIWHAVGTLEVLTRTGSIPPMIVVGIESTNRMRDFTLTVSENNPGSGGGKKFLEFIEKELIPYVESNYRTNAYRVLEGHSLGGLFTASTFMENPDLFNSYIVMSPSLWWNGEELTKKAQEFFKTNSKLKNSLFFGIGTYESGAEYGMRKELKNFVDVISENKPKQLRFERKEIEKEGHMSSVLLSNYHGLKFIFSDMNFPESLYKNYTDGKFLEHENYIMDKYGEAAKQSAESYVNLAATLRQQEKYPEAITVLKRSVSAYPFDVGLMNFLANTYEKNDDIDSAIATYKNAIATSKKNNYNREEEFKTQIERLIKK
ncbi:alpha/beta hydrolase-fold protein [Winogradskyella sp.]|uniref:alpha/beta hydrolase-fold protein n=1 Tax=Winogradskyella sp. TaxID=1883156 RepID=UPI0026381845|nr:alpha/beta hydrolase-fold protein [Winogradskyella sp.]